MLTSMHKLLLRRDQDLQKRIKKSCEMEDATAKLQREVFSFPAFSAKKNRIVRNSREMADVTAKLKHDVFSFHGFSAKKIVSSKILVKCKMSQLNYSANCFHFPDFQRTIVSSKILVIADVTAKLKCDVFSFPGFSAKQFWCTECN